MLPQAETEGLNVIHISSCCLPYTSLLVGIVTCIYVFSVLPLASAEDMTVHFNVLLFIILSPKDVTRHQTLEGTISNIY